MVYDAASLVYVYRYRYGSSFPKELSRAPGNLRGTRGVPSNLAGFPTPQVVSSRFSEG